MANCKIKYNGSVISEWEEDGEITVTYNNVGIKTFPKNVTGLSTATLPCKNKYMAGNISVGNKQLPCRGMMMKSDLEIDVENPETIFYLFDSRRSDNFLFGEYHYKPFVGAVNSTAETSWPASNDDGINTNASKIVLRSSESGFMQPTGSSPAYLLLEPNSFGTNNPGLFANNVTMTIGGKQYGPISVGLPLQECTININAYCTKSGSATITYEGTNKSVTVSGTSSKTYSISTQLVKDGSLLFESVKGCGDFIITDIWIEYKE